MKLHVIVSILETICRNVKSCFSGKNKKNFTNLSSAEAHRMVKIKELKCSKFRVNMVYPNYLVIQHGSSLCLC